MDSSQEASTEVQKSGKDALKLKSMEFYKEKIDVLKRGFSVSSSIYAELGQYKFEGETNFDNIQELMYEDSSGHKYYYVGQFKDGKKDGVGILVFEEGLIHEGYYKDDNLNGPCRLISGAGLYFICEYKNGEKEGYGEYYHQDGTTYKGQFKESCYHGEGTLTHPDGKVESGLWEYHQFKG